MTDYADIVNRALQAIGTRTTVTAADLASPTSNEAKQANVILYKLRDELLRLAPWNCCKATMELVYITSQPGTPENQSASTFTWERGQPSPPWLYEYQYPTDCVRPVRIIPQFQPGYAGAVPIFPSPTGNTWNYNGWAGPPILFEVSTDRFLPVTAAAVVAGGTGYVVGDQITLPYGDVTDAPIGAPVILQVATLSGSAVATVSVVTQVYEDDTTKFGGSYFSRQTGTIAQDTTTGSGTGATFTLTFGSEVKDQRVVLCNQQDAAMTYCRRVTNPNVFDELFQKAYYQALGAKLSMGLSGKEALVKRLTSEVNVVIDAARTVDGNEGLVVNDSTPDWLRVRGYGGNSPNVGAGNYGFDWGGSWSPW